MSKRVFQRIFQEFKSKSFKLPKKVKIFEMGPRDGLQNEEQILSLEFKLKMIHDLVDAGVKYIEAGSFVSPKWIPQMANTTEIFAQLQRKEGVTYSALVPNLIGMRKALESGVKEVAVFTAASESFTKKNVNASIDQTIKNFEEVIAEANKAGVKVRGYVSCVLGCPYEGEVSPQKVNEVTKRLLDIGCYEVSLGDTIGKGTPQTTTKLFDALTVDPKFLAAHFHDTYGNAFENLLIALQRGVSVIDSSVAGIGGCPYAKKRVGNVCTENVLEMLEFLEIQTGIDLQKMKIVGAQVAKDLGRQVEYIF